MIENPIFNQNDESFFTINSKQEANGYEYVSIEFTSARDLSFWGDLPNETRGVWS